MQREDIDVLKPQRHLIDLESHSEGAFDSDNLILSQVYDDVLLVEYIDMTDDGENITRGGLIIPANAQTKAWRKARVILVGPKVSYTEVGDIVTFPNDKGMTIANLEVIHPVSKESHKIKKGVFLNEDRLFGKCKQK